MTQSLRRAFLCPSILSFLVIGAVFTQEPSTWMPPSYEDSHSANNLPMRTSSSITRQESVNFTNGLIDWWRGENNANDAIGDAHGTFEGTVSYGSGIRGQAFQLNGIDSFINIPHNPIFDFGTMDFTISLWVNFTSIEGEMVLIEKYVEKFSSSSSIGWTLTKLSTNELRFAVPPYDFDMTPPSIPLNSWINIAITRTKCSLIFYWNSQVLLSTSSIDITPSISSLKFGHRGNPTDTPGSMDSRGYYLNGLMDEIRVYNRGLSEQEVFLLYKYQVNKHNHDITVGLQTPNYARVDTPYLINATIWNTGASNESNIEFILYLDGVILPTVSCTISTLLTNENLTLSYEWSPFSMMVYNFTACTLPVVNETFTSDNFDTDMVQGLDWMYTPHSPIKISNNDGFAAIEANGTGSATNPYILEGLYIVTMGEHPIYIHDTSAYFVIRNCWVESREAGIGIYIQNATDGTVTLDNNICHKNQRGIYLDHSGSSTITNNLVTNASGSGIFLKASGRNSLIGNTVTDNGGTGIGIGEYIPFSGGGESHECVLINNSIINNQGAGIELVGSSNCVLMNNTIAANNWNGIGIELGGSSNFIFFNNIIINNNYGIDIYYSDNNAIYYNNFINNVGGTSQVYVRHGDMNNFTYNYWSDWTGPDEDDNGIVDHPYPIEGDGNNSDIYPLVTPYPLPTHFPHFGPWTRVSPSGGGTYFGLIPITCPVVSNHEVFYTISYSANNGSSWVTLVSGLTTLPYLWDTTTVDDGDQYLIRINVTCTCGATDVTTSNSPFTIHNSHLSPFTVLSPGGGNIYFGSVTIQWSTTADRFYHEVIYTISYSADNGGLWVTLISGLTNLTYIWDSTTATDGSHCLIQVTAMCAEGSWRVATSGVFILDNVPPLTSLSSRYLSDSSVNPEPPLDILPVLQLLSSVGIVAFVGILMVVVRRHQMG
ncbi:MAG: NosD domain-containing protein [Promethearchaeota archaeon]